MASAARLRDLFDEAPTPHIAHPPRTHHRDYYVATDGSFLAGRGGLGVIVETGTGERLLRLARVDDAPDNNVAEYRALQLGLDALAAHADDEASVGVLVDHNDLAANVNAAALGLRAASWPAARVSVPEAAASHWRHIRGRLRGFGDLRAASIRSDENPAHGLANAPEAYHHLDADPTTDVATVPGSPASRDWAAPPPSRADRGAPSDRSTGDRAASD